MQDPVLKLFWVIVGQPLQLPGHYGHQGHHGHHGERSTVPSMKIRDKPSARAEQRAAEKLSLGHCWAENSKPFRKVCVLLMFAISFSVSILCGMM